MSLQPITVEGKYTLTPATPNQLPEGSFGYVYLTICPVPTYGITLALETVDGQWQAWFDGDPVSEVYPTVEELAEHLYEEDMEQIR